MSKVIRSFFFIMIACFLLIGGGVLACTFPKENLPPDGLPPSGRASGGFVDSQTVCCDRPPDQSTAASANPLDTSAESFLPIITSTTTKIPTQADWTEQGIALTVGPPGSWDVRFGGQINPATVVKKDGTFFLYYIGADGDRSTDGGPRHRALGVATSQDGINFTKYNGNPIITHLPHNNEEEGIFSAGATLDANGNVILYYGAMDAGSATSTSVDSDVRLAVSNNGLDFTDLGDAISHNDSSVWGYGDELFPVGTFEANGVWNVYYIAKGYNAYWDLGLARGQTQDELTNTQAVLTGGDSIVSGGDPVWLTSEQVVLFLVRSSDTPFIEARLTSAGSPGQLDSPAEVYNFGNDWKHTTVYLDKETATWFMYQKNEVDDIYVRTAPMIGGGN